MFNCCYLLVKTVRNNFVLMISFRYVSLQCVSFYAPNVCKNGLRSNCTYDLRMTLSTTIAVWLDYCVGDFLVVLESPFLHDEINDRKHQFK